MILPLFAAIVTIIAGSSPPPADPARTPEILRTAPDAADRMTVPVRIGEHGPYHFFIDTGAQATVLSTTVANALALPPLARRTILGVAGQRSVDTVEIDDIQLGRLSYNGLAAPVLARDDLGADGIVGLDGLQGQRVLLDFAGNRIALVDAHARGANSGYEIIVTARRKLGQLILTNATIDGINTDVIIDTGSDVSIGNRALQRALRHRQGATIELHSVTGQDITADIGIANVLAIDRMHIGNVGIAYADSPVFAALRLDNRPAMLLGMHELQLFRRVAIDFAARKVLFDLPPNSPGAG